MKALVIGYGSIGARHARVLESLGATVAVVSRQTLDRPRVYGDIAAALDAFAPDYVVVANATVDHAPALDTLAARNFAGIVLVEKPLFAEARALPAHRFKAAFVGYNLRFHPVLRALRETIGDRSALSAHAYVGQYLPDWRPGTDHRHGYSASRERGGGALRDLSHELDYLAWLFGPWTRLAALGGRLGDLTVDSDDAYGLLMALPRAPLTTLTMNYLDRTPQRAVTVNLDGRTLVADLIAQTLRVDGQTRTFDVARDSTYEAQHRAVLDGEHEMLCTLVDGAAVMNTIAAIERAATTNAWVTR